MRKFMKQFTGITLAVALVISSLAVAPEASAAPKAKKIVMNKKKVSLEVGQKFKLKVKKIKPSKAKKKVTYKVNKKGKSVVKVTKKGVIKALAVGKATVKVTAKSNKKAKAKVKVTVNAASVVTPTTAPTAAPTDAATVAPTGDVVAPTEAAKPTEKPTRTPKPTATPVKPTATPAPPAMKDPAAPYTLSFSNDTVTAQDGSSFEITNQGVVISVTEQYGGVAFNVPGILSGNNYDTVTVTYRTPQNVGPGFGCGLWRASGSSESDKATEDVIAWDGIFTEGNAGTYTATISGQDATNAYYINKALFFFNDTDTLNNGAARVTITSVVFSHSEYDGPLPTATPEPQKLEAVKLAGTITVDGEADDAWANIPAVPMDARITCDNAGGSSTSANLKLAWDANNLYGYAVVRDADIDATAENDYQRDGFEFFLDEDNSKETTYDTNADAFQYRFTGLTKDADGAKVAALSSLFAAGSDAARTAYEGIQIDYVYTDNGYAVEFKVPFAKAKKAKDVIGFDAIVQDCKNGGRDAELYLSDATRTMLYYNLTDTFPELELVNTATPATPAPVMPEAVEIAGGITVDGIADDVWADIAAITMGSRVICDNAGDSDTTAAIKLAWDANNLYGYALVDDSNIDATAEEDYRRDGIEIFLDENNSKENSYETNTDAFQYRFTGLTKDEDGAKIPALSSFFAAGLEEAHATYSGIQMEYVYTESGYAVEFKVPFASPKALNTVIGFDVLVQDCKNGGKDAEIYLSDTERTMNYWNLEDAYPEIRLVEEIAPVPTATPAPTEAPATPEPPVSDDLVLGFDNLSVPGWGTQATYTKNEDGSVTINWPAGSNDWGDIRFAFDEPMDLTGYESVIIETVENTTMNFSITDATKKDEYNNRASVGLRYGASFPLEVKLADILNSNVEDADYTNVYGVSIFKGQETEAISITVKSIRFIKAEEPEVTEAPSTEAPEPEETEVPATDEPTTTDAPDVSGDVVFDADSIVIVGVEDASATVNADGSVSYEAEDGFSGMMIPLPEGYVLNTGDAMEISIDYTSTGCDARAYLLTGTVDNSKSNIIGPGASPLTGIMTATADNVNYIFVKAASWDAKFTSLTVNAITLGDIVEFEPTPVPEMPDGNLAVNGDFSNGAAGWTNNYAGNNPTVTDGYGVYSGRWNNYSGAKYVINRRFAAGDVVTFSFDVKLVEDYEENGNVSFAYWFADAAGTEGTKYACYDADGSVVYGNAADWTTVIGTYTIPAYTESLTMVIAEGPGYNAERNADFCIDNLFIGTNNEEPAAPTEAPATEAPATEAPATEIPATDEPEATEVPAEALVEAVDLSDADSYALDGAVVAGYNAETEALDASFVWGTGLIIAAPTDDDFNKVEVTYTSDNFLNVYLFDSLFTDGIGISAAGQHEVTPKISASAEDNTITWEYTADFVKAIKFVALDGETNINIKSVNFIYEEDEPAPEVPTVSVSNLVDLTDAETYTFDNTASAVYNEETGALDVTYDAYGSIIFWAPEEEGVTYTQVKVTLANANTITFYLFDEDVTDAKGQTAAGQHPTNITSPTGTVDQTAYTLDAPSAANGSLTAVKLVRQSGNGTTSSITAVEFIGYKAAE